MGYQSRSGNAELLEYAVEKDRIVEILFREHTVYHTWDHHPVRATCTWTLGVDHSSGGIGRLVDFNRHHYHSNFSAAHAPYGSGTYHHPVV